MKTLILFGLFTLCAFGTMAQETPREFSYQEGDQTFNMKSYVLCLLKEGPERNQDSTEYAELMKGHLAHFNHLAEMGKIAMVGPIDEGSDLKGIIIFDVATIEEARKLEEQDPMIQANRLTMELHTWWAEKGATLP